MREVKPTSFERIKFIQKSSRSETEISLVGKGINCYLWIAGKKGGKTGYAYLGFLSGQKNLAKLANAILKETAKTKSTQVKMKQTPIIATSPLIGITYTVDALKHSKKKR